MPKAFNISDDQLALFEASNALANQAHQKGYGGDWNAFRTGTYMTGLIPSRVEQMLRDCNGGSPYLLNPRHNLPLWYSMWAAIPVFPNANNRLLDAVGRISVESDNKDLDTVLNRLFESIAVQHNRNQEGHTGMNRLIRACVTGKHRSGMMWAELMVNPGEGVTGARLPDPRLFDHRIEPDGNVVTTMRTVTTGIVDIQKSKLMQEWAGQFLTEDDYPWAMPMAYNAVFSASGYISAIKARSSAWRRIGNPPSITLISGGVAKDGAESEFIPRQTADGFAAFERTYKEQYKAGLAHSLATGEPFDMVMGIPGGNISLQTKMFGEGVSVFPDWPDEVAFWIKMLGMVTDVPAALTGFTTGGINAQEFSAAIRVLRSAGATLRDEIEPKVRQIIAQHLIAMKAPSAWLAPGAYKLIFEPATDDDLITKATGGKLDAEKVAIQIRNLAEMVSSGAVTEAERYAEEIGRPGLGAMEPYEPSPDMP